MFDVRRLLDVFLRRTTQTIKHATTNTLAATIATTMKTSTDRNKSLFDNVCENDAETSEIRDERSLLSILSIPVPKVLSVLTALSVVNDLFAKSFTSETCVFETVSIGDDGVAKRTVFAAVFSVVSFFVVAEIGLSGKHLQYCVSTVGSQFGKFAVRDRVFRPTI